MPSVAVSRFGEVTAADTPTALTLDANGATVNSQQPPPNTTMITGIIATGATDAASNGANVVCVSLSGTGVIDTQDIIVGANCVDGTPAAAAFTAASDLKVQIPTVAGGNILVEMSMQGDDTGDIRAGCTLIHE